MSSDLMKYIIEHSDLTQPVYEFEPDYDFSSSDIKEENIPEYLRIIFHDPSISNIERKRVIDKFMRRYINDEKYKNQVNGKYLLFLGGKYSHVINNTEEVLNFDSRGKVKKIIFIGKGKTFCKVYGNCEL